jgi:hypothetical protein
MSGAVILTGRSPRALWQRWRLWRAYARPVTFADLRRIAYDAKALEERGLAAGQALFDSVRDEAERGIAGPGS